MISDERKQALIEGAFYQAECLNELRWLNSIFHNTLDGLPWRAQFQLSAVLERRVMEFEGAETKSGFRVGEGSDCTPADAGSGGEVLPHHAARSTGTEPEELSGGDSDTRTAEAGIG